MKLSRLLSTVFYTGYSPIASGTMGSLAGFLVFWFIPMTSLWSVLLLILLTLGAVKVSGISEKDFGIKDDGRIVIDEFVGYGFAVIFFSKVFWYYFAAFLFFRFFDITKLFGARKLQDIKGGWGIVLDDVLAGIYANIVVTILIYLISW